MAFYKQLLSTVAFASIFLLDHTTTVYACSCEESHLCTSFQRADIVVLGTALSRTEKIGSISSFPEATYTISINTVYKGDPDMSNEQEIEVTTAAQGSLCGVDLELGDEYLLDLSDDGGELRADLCGLNKLWSSASDGDKANIEAGCVDDPCDFACRDYQECIQYERNEKWYCSDTCDNFRCFSEDELCTTRAKSWCRNSGAAGCPEKAICR